MNIALDVMGGDFGPEETVKGAYLFIKDRKECKVTLLGKKDAIEEVLKRYAFDKKQVEIIHCSDSVENDDLPSDVIRGKENSPIMVGMDLLKARNTDAFISAGNSGAVMAAALFKLGCIHDIKRPAIAAIIPTLKGKKIILDMGANVDCKPIHLMHFALMGASYARSELKIENPRVALLNIGEEKSKGNQLSREAFALLSEREDIDFMGNIEGRDIFLGAADVIVCDGFVGNIVLKTAEGLSSMFMTDFKMSILRDLPDDDTTRMLKEKFARYAKMRNYKTYGGAPLLGVNGLCFICHGRSKAEAMKNALNSASIFIENHGLEHLKELDFKSE